MVFFVMIIRDVFRLIVGVLFYLVVWGIRREGFCYFLYGIFKMVLEKGNKRGGGLGGWGGVFWVGFVRGYMVLVYN